MSPFQRHGGLLFLLLCLGLVGPVVVDPGPAPIGWDDAHYLHRMACLNHALFDPGPDRPGDCFRLVVKAPLMAWLGLPWGTQAATASGLGLAAVSLAALSFAVFLVIAELLVRSGVPWPAVGLAFAAVGADRLARDLAGAFLGDLLAAALIILILLLPLAEQTSSAAGWRTAVGRGLGWGALMALAVMAKTSAGFFVVVIAPQLLVLRLRRHGWRDAGLTVAALAAAALPVVVYHLIWWDQVIGHALLSAAGPVAKFYSYDLDAIGYLTVLAARIGWPTMVLTGLAAVAAIAHGGHRARWALLWPLTVLLVYLGLAAISQNHDLRFGLPVVLGLPLLLPAFCAGTGPAPAWVARPAAIRGLAAGLAALMMAMPMVTRFDLRFVREAQQALIALPAARPLSVLVGSDDSAINFETFRLAQQLALPRLRHLAIDTVIYDEAMGAPRAAVLDRVARADVVILLRHLPIRKAPAWTNALAPAIRERLVAEGAVLAPSTSPNLELFMVRGGDRQGR